MKNNINKTLAALIYDCIDYIDMPNSYMLFLSKYISNAEWGFKNRLEKLKKFAENNHGEIKIIDKISGDNIIGGVKRVRFELVADVVPMKEFDKIIDKSRENRNICMGYNERKTLRESILNEYKGEG